MSEERIHTRSGFEELVDASPSAGSTPGMLDRWCRDLVIAHLKGFAHGSLVIDEPSGESMRFGSGEPAARLRMRDWRAWRMLCSGGALGAGEGFMDGLWESDDLVGVIRYFAANIRHTRGLDEGLARVLLPFRQFLHFLNRNSISGSRRNIAAHYDLGNDFFRLFLDRTMMYSSAIFARADMSLDDAAVHKLDVICRKLELGPEHHLLEIGTGWGGLALHAARHYGCRVTTTTISREQFLHAREQVRAAGLEDRVQVLDRDYRELEGRFDRVVSVEMLEAVGHQFLSQYFDTLQRLVKPDGLILLQAITIPDQRYQSALRNVDFIKRYIFPGGFLPSVSVLASRLAERTDLVLRHVEDIGHDYAVTLEHWRRRYLDRLGEVRELGFDDRFIRMWDYYLAYCEGAFRERAISTVQLLAAGPGWRPVPSA